MQEYLLDLATLREVFPTVSKKSLLVLAKHYQTKATRFVNSLPATDVASVYLFLLAETYTIPILTLMKCHLAEHPVRIWLMRLFIKTRWNAVSGYVAKELAEAQKLRHLLINQIRRKMAS